MFSPEPFGPARAWIFPFRKRKERFFITSFYQYLRLSFLFLTSFYSLQKSQIINSQLAQCFSDGSVNF